jgi:hypothetical protein
VAIWFQIGVPGAGVIFCRHYPLANVLGLRRSARMTHLRSDRLTHTKNTILKQTSTMADSKVTMQMYHVKEPLAVRRYEVYQQLPKFRMGEGALFRLHRFVSI